jgi:hypothetical protein
MQNIHQAARRFDAELSPEKDRLGGNGQFGPRRDL